MVDIMNDTLLICTLPVLVYTQVTRFKIGKGSRGNSIIPSILHAQIISGSIFGEFVE